MLGGILVKAAFAACLVSVVSYFQFHRNGKQSLLLTGRIAYFFTVATVFATAGYFLSLILTHQFQYTYVWSYSSRELSTPLLVSTFYAGQEGSFMLWTMYTSLIGIFLVLHSRSKGYEPEVMTFFGLIELALLTMLIVKNPFLYVWESWPGQVAAGFVPVNGRGLNPLLQNYWMVIHPQVLFSGFSSMGVPYAYAMAALLKKDYKNWIRPATPWLVLGATILGTGIMMGGFWAYETLGWGGYWGWDPVENSSLVPWLFCVASIHTTLSQRKSGGFLRTNLVLAIMCFIMVLYSTFLTRSGVLGETSVHSFVDPGMWAYWLLIGMIVTFAGLAVFMLWKRWKEIPRPIGRQSFYTREMALFVGSSALVAAALLISAGTSSPIITEILHGTKSAVDTSYYVTTILPIGILIGLLSGVAQLLWWNRSTGGGFWKSLRAPALLAAGTTLVLVIVSVHDVLVAMFVYAAAFSLFANIQVGMKIARGNPKFAGGSVAHIGLAVMFLGFTASSKYDQKETIALAQGKPVHSLGYTLTYTGYHPIDNQRYAFQVNIEKGDQRYTVNPIMYYTSYNDGLMRNPDIANLYTKDFYLAPLSLEQNSDSTAGGETVELKRGETKMIGSLRITFVDFDFPVMQKAAMLEGKEVRIGAKLMVRQGSGKQVPVEPAKIIKAGEQRDETVKIGDAYELSIAALHPDREAKENSRVSIGVRDLQAAANDKASQGDVLMAEASVKPFINLVWSGLIIVMVGFLVTIFRRGQEARLPAGVAASEEP
ncbi:MAG TPA: cytochrome c biogenesis protein CcsA [Bacteroidota bacterium]|nr:cytochrome c biogenesis protein CcsA [Bacteroidota bacterium]